MVKNQIIVRKNGHSWLGFWTRDDKFNTRLNEIYKLTERYKKEEPKWHNAFWVLDKEGLCIAAQPSLAGAIRYITDERILVHNQDTFV